MSDQPKTLCPEPALYRYTWPGQPEKFICAKHLLKASMIAQAMGFPLYFHAVFPPKQCHQEINPAEIRPKPV